MCEVSRPTEKDSQSKTLQVLEKTGLSPFNPHKSAMSDSELRNLGLAHTCIAVSTCPEKGRKTSEVRITWNHTMHTSRFRFGAIGCNRTNVQQKE